MNPVKRRLIKLCATAAFFAFGFRFRGANVGEVSVGVVNREVAVRSHHAHAAAPRCHGDQFPWDCHHFGDVIGLAAGCFAVKEGFVMRG